VHKAIANESNPKVEEVNARSGGSTSHELELDSLSKVNLVKSAVTSILASPNRLHYGFEVEVEFDSAHQYIIRQHCRMRHSDNDNDSPFQPAE
jgi:hypothetical protein